MSSSLTSTPAPSSSCIPLDGCPSSEIPKCPTCGPNQICSQINRTCTTCPRNICVDNAVSSPSGGVSKGAVAGAIVGVVIFFTIAIFLFLRHRKRSLIRRHRSSPPEIKDIPAPAETVLNRPDPTEKPPSDLGAVRVYSSHSSTTIDLDPHSKNTSHRTDEFGNANPFEDASSIQTAGTEATNVIPIAFVPPDSQRISLSQSEASSHPSHAPYPVRPARSPELNLNLDHVNVSHDNLRTKGYTKSTISGISGVSSRNSYMSSASYSSDFLNEAPMIMVPTKGAVRQVVGVVKAEVISAGSLSPNNSSDSLRPPAYSKPAIKSPLASTSFGPTDMLREESEEGQDATNPFADKHISTQAAYAASASPSKTTFDHDTQSSMEQNWDPAIPNHPWSGANNGSRPSSMSTQAGSVIDIASAKRVNVGLNGPKTPASANSYRTTMGRLVTPPTNGTQAGTLQEQQQRALAHAQAQAQAQGLDRRRISNASVLSAASTRADSILESFPFVPPSPISDRPIRSPPASPLAQQSFTNPSSSPLHKHTFVVAPPSPLTPKTFTSEATKMAFMDTDPLSGSLPAPPDRRTLLGLSTGSQLSTASSGLGSFPFQIESEPTADNGPPPSSFNRQRASLDTLALTSDLSSYPLGFDRDGSTMPLKRK